MDQKFVPKDGVVLAALSPKYIIYVDIIIKIYNICTYLSKYQP
jgi:hypothetical protein